VKGKAAKAGAKATKASGKKGTTSAAAPKVEKKGE
jgi:hypothetical protein